MKRIFSITIALAIILTMTALAGAAASELTEEEAAYRALFRRYNDWLVISNTGEPPHNPGPGPIPDVSLLSVEGYALFAMEFAPTFAERYLNDPEREYIWPVGYEILLSAIPFELPPEWAIPAAEAVAIARETMRTRYGWINTLLEMYREPAVTYRVYGDGMPVWHVGFGLRGVDYYSSYDEYTAILNRMRSGDIPGGGSVYIDAGEGSVIAAYELVHESGFSSGVVDDNTPRFGWVPGMPTPTPMPMPSRIK